MQRSINSNRLASPPRDLLRPGGKESPIASAAAMLPAMPAEKQALSSEEASLDAHRATAQRSPSPTRSIGRNWESCKTPSPMKSLPPKMKTFLDEDMARPDLVPLMLFLLKEYGSDWAVSGSVALHMHAIRLEAGDEMTRTPGDVDIVMRDQRVESLQEKLRNNNHDHRVDRPPFSSNPSTFHFGDGLKVDVLQAGAGVYGNLEGTIRIAGLPVLSLDQLIASKKSALKVALDQKMAVAGQYGEDLRLLEQLQQKEKISEETSRQASSSLTGQKTRRNTGPYEGRAKRVIALGLATQSTQSPSKLESALAPQQNDTGK